MTIEFTRFHRLRRSPGLREILAESVVSPRDLIMPIFVEEGIDAKVPIKSMPGICRVPESQLAQYVRELEDRGVHAVILFGVSHHKDESGSDTWQPDGLLARMTGIAKESSRNMVVVADSCVCEYTSHGHCGEVGDDGHLLNDKSIENLAMQAVVAARSGADIIAPSSMLDGQVMAIRRALDSEGFSHIPIMSYSSKFASSFYGPFREAGGASLKGDRNAYQIDYRNGRQALLESFADEQEGADILMVKPGMLYLDVIARLRDATQLPICTYNISGEYAMIKNAAQAGILDEKRAVHEVFTAFKRAGADLIISYSTVDYLEWFCS